MQQYIYHSRTKMNPVDVKSNTCIDFSKENVISDINDEEIVGTFYEKEWQKTNQKEFRIETVIQRKGDKLYFKWKVYDNSCNSWIDKKDIVV